MKKAIIITAIIVVAAVALVVAFKDVIFPPSTDISTPPPQMMHYDDFEQMAQSIKDDSFWKERNYYIDSGIMEIMKNTNIIKPMAGNEDFVMYESDWDEDGEIEPEQITLYCAATYGYTREYFAKFKYKDYDEWVMFEAWYSQMKYSEDDVCNEVFPEVEGANYDAVINGQNVRVRYMKTEYNRHFCNFKYKNMYNVSVFSDNKELLDEIMQILTIEEISVK